MAHRHEGSDMEELHVGELADAVCVAPLREAPGGVQVRLALWPLLILAVKNSRTRFAALGVGVNSGAG